MEEEKRGSLELGFADKDRSSTLFDEFERLTFEIQLNQAILRRSYSEPITYREFVKPTRYLPPLALQQRPECARPKWRRLWRVPAALGRWLKPVLKGVGGGGGSGRRRDRVKPGEVLLEFEKKTGGFLERRLSVQI